MAKARRNCSLIDNRDIPLYQGSGIYLSSICPWKEAEVRSSQKVDKEGLPNFKPMKIPGFQARSTDSRASKKSHQGSSAAVMLDQLSIDRLGYPCFNTNARVLPLRVSLSRVGHACGPVPVFSSMVLGVSSLWLGLKNS